MLYKWYYEGITYKNDVEGQGVEPGDFSFRFEVMDAEGNSRFYDHLEIGVSPIFVHVNIHTDDEYINVVDNRGKDVEEIAADDDVRVRVWIEINKGRKGHLYEFYVEFRVDGTLVDDGKRFVQIEGKSGSYIFFDWEPVKGDHTLSIECDSDNDISEIDESDNDASKEVTVLGEVHPAVVISHPIHRAYYMLDEYIIFDASNSTNPLCCPMDYSWTIYKLEDEEWSAKSALEGARVVSSKRYGELYGAGMYKAEVEVENDKRESVEDVVFYINSDPVLDLVRPRSGEEYPFGTYISFNATASYDPDGDDLFFTWISSIDGVLNWNIDEERMDFFMSSFSRTLARGEHEITLEIRDYNPADPPENGRRGASKRVINITVNRPPEIKISSPVSGVLYSPQEPVELNASGTTDPDAHLLNYTWYEGDRILNDGMKTFYTFIPGPHDLRLVVNDSYEYPEKIISIFVGDRPTASAETYHIVSLKNGNARVELNALGSRPSIDSFPIVRYVWDTDGMTDTSGDRVPDNDSDIIGNDPVTVLEYNASGLYHVILWVEDTLGLKSEPFPVTIIVLGEQGGEGEGDDEDHMLILFHLLLFMAILICALILIIRMPADQFGSRRVNEKEGMVQGCGAREATTFSAVLDNDSFKPPA